MDEVFGLRRLSIQASTSAVFAALVFCAACWHRPSLSPHRSEVAGPSFTAPSTPDAEIGQLQALTCKPGVTCCVRETLAAGTDEEGHRLTVITVSEGSCIEHDGPQSGGRGDDFALGCDQYWLATAKQPSGVTVAWLGEQCPNGRLEVNTSVDAQARTFTHGNHSLFSNARTDTTVTIALAPLHLKTLSASSQSFGRGRDEFWNFDEFAGELKLRVDYCPHKPSPGGDAATDRDAPEIGVSAVGIPRVELPVAFRDSGWRTTRLGRCGARIGGAKNGFAVAGGPAQAGDVAFVVLLSTDNDLFVEIDDDRFSGSGADKLLDELLIWLARPEPCVDPAHASAVRKLAIRVADGRVVTTRSPVTHPVVEVEKAVHAVRLRVKLGDLIGSGERLTVAYADAHANRTFASSPLEPGKWWTLGEAFEVPAEVAMPWARLSCALEGDILVPTPIIPLR